MVDVIYLSGAERSGTNYLEWLLRNNFKDLIIIVMWKHYPPRDFINEMKWNGLNQQSEYNNKKKRIDSFLNQTLSYNAAPYIILSGTGKFNNKNLKHKASYVKENITKSIIDGTMKFIINIKNPYGWHLSYTKRWKKYKFPQCMDKWATMYTRWLNFMNKFPKSTIILKHEDLLKDYSSMLDTVQSKFNLETSNKKFITVSSELSSTCFVKKNSFKKANYYMNEVYMKNVTKANADECRKFLPVDLMSEFGYEIL